MKGYVQRQIEGKRDGKTMKLRGRKRSWVEGSERERDLCRVKGERLEEREGIETRCHRGG